MKTKSLIAAAAVAASALLTAACHGAPQQPQVPSIFSPVPARSTPDMLFSGTARPGELPFCFGTTGVHDQRDGSIRVVHDDPLCQSAPRQ